MKITARFVILSGLLALLPSGLVLAQSASKTKGAPPPPAAARPEPAPTETPPASQPGWVVRCVSTSRDAPLECAMEETAVLTKTGQLVVLVNIRVAGDTHAPTLLVQLPLGLNLPAGIKLQVDDGKATDLHIQTCENRGCYSSTPLAPDVLTALRSGKQIKISFQNMNNETLTIPIPLTDFAAAYDKIK
jgi:invasion protein IalB